MTPTPEIDAAYQKLLDEAGAFDAWFAKDGGALNRSAAFTGWIARATAALAPSAKGAPSCDAPWDMWMCESQRLLLHPGRAYRFKYDPECDSCMKLKREYDAAMAVSPSPDSNASSVDSVGASAQGVRPPLQSPNAKGD
jgi:hypothetical protein